MPGMLDRQTANRGIRESADVGTDRHQGCGTTEGVCEPDLGSQRYPGELCPVESERCENVNQAGRGGEGQTGVDRGQNDSR